MKNWLYEKCSVLFVLTLVCYLSTLYFTSYVGVYLTYFSVPTIVITGFIAYVTRPEDDKEKTNM